MRFTFALIVAVSLVVLSFTPSTFGAVMYAVTDLGSFGGNGESQAYAINNNGQVVGNASTSTFETHAFLYSGGVMRDLGSLGGASGSYATSINGLGQVSGWAYTSGGGPYHAFLHSNDSMQDIGALGGNINNSTAHAINDNGQVVGDSNPYNGSIRAFLYSNGVMENLGTLGGDSSRAFGINNSGQVVGVSVTSGFFGAPDGIEHAFLYTNGVMTDLGSLAGNAYYSRAYAINDGGEVVGGSISNLDGNVFHAFIYSGGVMHDLGSLNGRDSVAYGINASSQVVGIASFENTPGHAFLYSMGSMQDLNQLIDPASGWTLTSARDINDSGQIVGYGVNPFGIHRGFLLTPVPTPSTMLPFALATAVLSRRRR